MFGSYGESGKNVGIGDNEVGNADPTPPGNLETNCKGVASLF
jgi:hypothetical protein